jgi:succinoglycan biosynthesis protein ExoO
VCGRGGHCGDRDADRLVIRILCGPQGGIFRKRLQDHAQERQDFTMRSPDLPERVPLRPAVSVIMANYNGAAHLADAIRSIQGQTLRNLEIIVSDDASSDDSVRIVTELRAEDPRIRLVRGERNSGPAAARNRALPLAKGEWIAVMDSDDLMHPDRLTTLVQVARRDNADMVADNLVEFDTSGSKPPRPLLSGRWARKPFWVEICRYIQLNHFYGRGPGLGYLKPLFRKTILTGPTAYYDETLRIAEDYNLVLRLLYAGRRMRVYPLPLYFYRKHSASISHRLNESALEALKAADVRFLGKISRGNQAVAGAVKRRMKSVETALAFEKLLNALKSRNWPAAIGIALTKPRAAALLRFPLGVRLRGLAPSRVPRITVAHPLVPTTPRLLHENQRGPHRTTDLL